MKIKRNPLYFLSSFAAFVALFMIVAATSFHFHSFSLRSFSSQDALAFCSIQNHFEDEEGDHCSLCVYLNSVSFSSSAPEQGSLPVEKTFLLPLGNFEKISFLLSFNDLPRAPPASF